jgi:hypothetical protein
MTGYEECKEGIAAKTFDPFAYIDLKMPTLKYASNFANPAVFPVVSV